MEKLDKRSMNKLLRMIDNHMSYFEKIREYLTDSDASPLNIIRMADLVLSVIKVTDLFDNMQRNTANMILESIQNSTSGKSLKINMQNQPSDELLEKIRAAVECVIASDKSPLN